MAIRNRLEEFVYTTVEFYDPHNPFGALRVASRRRDFGAYWRDVSSPLGAQFILRWLAATGELVAESKERIILLGTTTDEEGLEAALERWGDHCSSQAGDWPDNSLIWVRRRLLAHSIYRHTLLCGERRVARSFWLKACPDLRSLCLVHVDPEPLDQFGHTCEQIPPAQSAERWVIRLPEQFETFLKALALFCRLDDRRPIDLVSVPPDNAFVFILCQETPGHTTVALRNPDLEIVRLEVWEWRALRSALLAWQAEAYLLLGDAASIPTLATAPASQ